MSNESLFKEIDELLESHAVPLSLTTENTADPQLRKSIGLGSGIALIVSSIIGSGIFASPGPVLKYTESVGMALVVWFVAGLLALTGALCYAELGTMITDSGGEHPYLMRAYGSLPAFLFSWTGITVTRPASIAIICVICAEYVGRLIYFTHPGDAVSQVLIKFIAIVVIILLTAVNCLSTKAANRLQNVWSVF